MVFNAGCDDYLRKPFREEELFELLHKHLGVEFVYETEETSIEDQQEISQGPLVEATMMQEALAELPAEWLTALEESAASVDVEGLAAAIEQIRGHNATLADFLAGLADDFEYDEILNFTLCEGVVFGVSCFVCGSHCQNTRHQTPNTKL